MCRSRIGLAWGVAVLAGVLISSELAMAQFADSTRRSMGNLNPNPSRRSMGNLRPEVEQSQTHQPSGSGIGTVAVPSPFYPGYSYSPGYYYYDPGYYYVPGAVYPGYGPYAYRYGYPRNYHYPPGYYYRYYTVPPPMLVPSQMLFGPQATRRFMGR